MRPPRPTALHLALLYGLAVFVAAAATVPSPSAARFVLWLAALLLLATVALVAAQGLDPTGWVVRRALGGLTWPRAVVALLLLGFVAYYVFRGVFTQFYGPLGLMPEDVGLGYGDVLQLAAATMAVAAAAVLAGLLAVGLLAYAGALAITLGRGRLPGAVTALLVPAELARTARIGVAAALGAALSCARRSAALLLAGGALAALAFVAGLYAGAAAEAAGVMQGGDARRSTVLGVTLPPVRAERVVVRWMHDRVPDATPDVGRCAYLGQAGGTTVLYDVDHRRVFRLPTDAVAVFVDGDRSATSCFGPGRTVIG
jgi:hypothetical protein